MPVSRTGRAATIATNLPTSKTVSTATNATPIVVTTTTNHGLTTNEIVVITGVTGNTASNGTWVVFVTSATQFSLQVYPTLANSVGSGAYVAGGTVQSYGFGLTVPIPVDITDMMRAGSVNVPFEALLDMAAYLLYRATYIGNFYLPLAGGTMTGTIDYCSWRTQTGQTDRVFSGATLQLDSGSNVDLSGSLTGSSTSSFPMAGSITRSGNGATYADRDGVVTASAVTFTIDTTADCWALDTPSPAGNVSTVTVKSTTPTPANGTTLRFVAFSIPGINTVNLVREDASVIAKFGAGGTGIDWGACDVRFIGGVWRLVSLSVDQDATGPGRVTP